MINYSIYSMPNPQKREEVKFYGRAQYNNVMGINEFAQHIASHGCVYSRADIAAILTLAVDCIREQLLAGQKIELGDLGAFYLTLACNGADSATDFHPDIHIKGVKVRWSPGVHFTNLVQEAEFNLVANRKAQALLLKALKAGETTVNLNDDPSTTGPTEDEPTDEGDGNGMDNGSGGGTDSGSGESNPL